MLLRALHEAREVRLLAAGLPRRVGAAHRALPLEDRAFVDDEVRAVDVARHLARRAELEPSPRGDIARHLALDDDRGSCDLRLDERTLADRERVLRRNLALDVALDADRAFERELARDLRALAEEGARSAAGVLRPHLLFPLEHLHLPGRRGFDRRRNGLGGPCPLVALAILAEQRHGWDVYRPDRRIS